MILKPSSDNTMVMVGTIDIILNISALSPLVGLPLWLSW